MGVKSTRLAHRHADLVGFACFDAHQPGTKMSVINQKKHC